MDVKSEILNYIHCNEPTGALLITGKWGCGKTYLVNKIAEEITQKKEAAVAVISLFGLDSISAINQRVREEYLSFTLGSFRKKTKKLRKVFANFVKDGLDTASIMTNNNPTISAASRGLSAIMSYDLFDFLEVKKSIGKGENLRNFVLVFDDLERSDLKKKDLLGTINEYIENKQIKVIIIADQDKITAPEYLEYKEKLISRTIRMTADCNLLTKSIVDEYKETQTGYQTFIKENLVLLQQVFTESNSENLRTLKSILADFERFFSAWRKTEIATDNMKWALYTFAADVFTSKEYHKPDKNQSTLSSSILESEDEHQYQYKGKNESSFFAFSEWIKQSAWDEKSFISELEEKYKVVEKTPAERFLSSFLWSLEQKDIDEGLPKVVEQAYNGLLSIDKLRELLAKLHAFNLYRIALPCEVDYARIEAGLKQRIEGIRQGAVSEKPRFYPVEENQIDENAKNIGKMIYQLKNQVTAWQNRKEYIEYICEKPTNISYYPKALHIDEFDDDFLDTFIKQYTKAKNEIKRDYAVSFLGLIFYDANYSSKENMLVTIQNYSKLIKFLKSKRENDAISKVLNESFSENLERKLKELESISLSKNS